MWRDKLESTGMNLNEYSAFIATVHNNLHQEEFELHAVSSTSPIDKKLQSLLIEAEFFFQSFEKWLLS